MSRLTIIIAICGSAALQGCGDAYINCRPSRETTSRSPVFTPAPGDVVLPLSHIEPVTVTGHILSPEHDSVLGKEDALTVTGRVTATLRGTPVLFLCLRDLKYGNLFLQYPAIRVKDGNFRHTNVQVVNTSTTTSFEIMLIAVNDEVHRSFAQLKRRGEWGSLGESLPVGCRILDEVTVHRGPAEVQ